MPRCQDCGQGKAEYGDPRDTPLDIGVCLCYGCYKMAIEEAISELDFRRDRLIAQLAAADKRKAGHAKG